MRGKLAALIGAAALGATALTGCGGNSDTAADTQAAAQSEADAIVDDLIDEVLSTADDPGLVLTDDDRAALNAYQGTVATISTRATRVADCAGAGDIACVTAQMDGLSKYAARQIVRLEPITEAVDLSCLRASGRSVKVMLNHYVTANVYFSTGDVDSAVSEVNDANELMGESSDALEACTEAHT